MKRKVFVSTLVVLALTLMALTAVFAAEKPVDATLSAAPTMYVPTAADLAYNGVTAGDVAEGDVLVVGNMDQYTGLVLNGHGVDPHAPHPFLKVQQADGDGFFDHAACYLGNNGSAGSFGLGFFPLSQPFTNAHMRASRVGATVTIEFTSVNGGVLPDQTYVCDGAPLPPGDKIGTLGYLDIAKIDNFSDGIIVLDTFSYVGPLGATGNWNDASPGMHADGSRASGDFLALSFWIGETGCPPKFIDLTLNQGLRIDLSTANEAQTLYLIIISNNGQMQNVGPFNLPAQFCQAIQTTFMPTNPPISAIIGVLWKNPGVIYDVLPIQ